MKQDLISRAAALIMSKNRFLIATHVNPDGDAIGSSLALGEILGTMGKDVVCYCETPVPDRYLFMPGAYQFTAELAAPEQREV
ncbi:MAG: bifunctional oligoribonuclease/PAP phosphatase NrnA, partial [Desulfobacterales bacterium]|nr:bifunctional oligoribonuclease/PAP phosphatase NrnA [Desulfobacterales bacterium]